MLKEQVITSFTPQACLYRALRRPIVEELFAKRYAVKRLPNGKKEPTSRKDRMKYDFEARQLWRSIIIESNKL